MASLRSAICHSLTDSSERRKETLTLSKSRLRLQGALDSKRLFHLFSTSQKRGTPQVIKNTGFVANIGFHQYRTTQKVAK